MDDSEPDVCEVWAEHLPALRIFGAMQSQWLMDANGAETGLNYAALPIVEQRLGLSPRRARQAFPHLQVMEQAGIEYFRERRR